MAAEHREAVTEALQLKQLGNRVQELVGGRPVHPVNTLVGGFGRLPRQRELVEGERDRQHPSEHEAHRPALAVGVDPEDDLPLDLEYVGEIPETIQTDLESRMPSSA